MKIFAKIYIIFLAVLTAGAASAQYSFITYDYQNFGRKEPISLGAVFSALGSSPILVNPANIAFVTDNRVNFGGGSSVYGSGSFISWMAPNLSISSSTQKLDLSDTLDLNYEKQLLHFNFGISTSDLGHANEKKEFAIGFAVKRQADRVKTGDDITEGGDAVSVDIGTLLKIRSFAFEFVIVDINNPDLNSPVSQLSYDRGYILGGRMTTKAGLILALQGIGGGTHSGSDFGLNIAAEQSFLQHRLISRMQLTSFFSGSEATMQNISCGVGYRLDPKEKLIIYLKDMEFCYALSFLSLPKNIGTHLVSLTKYF